MLRASGLLLLLAAGLAAGQTREVDPPFKVVWDNQRVAWIWLKPYDERKGWDPESEEIRSRLTEEEAAVLGVSDRPRSLLRFDAQKLRNPWLGVALEYGPCADVIFQLLYRNGTLVEQRLGPLDLSLRGTVRDGFGAATNRIAKNLERDTSNQGNLLARFTWGTLLDKQYGQVLREEPWLKERGCANVKRQQLPAPFAVNSLLRNRNSRTYSIDKNYLKYGCSFEFGLNYTVRLPGKPGSRRQSCDRTFTVDSDRIRLDCRTAGIDLGIATTDVCREPTRVCDVDCNPVRVWWSNRTGQLQRLDPIKPAEKFLKFHWAFARRGGQLGNRLIRKYKLRYYPAEMRDDGSLLRLGNQFETERPAGQPYYELPALTYPQQQSKNYSLQVCAVLEPNCETVRWDEERMFPIEYVDDVDARLRDEQPPPPGPGRLCRGPRGSTDKCADDPDAASAHLGSLALLLASLLAAFCLR